LNNVRPTFDAARRSMGFLSLSEILSLCEHGVMMPDPASVLISRDVQVEPDTILWPHVILQSAADSQLTIGTGTILFPGTRIVALDGGSIVVGSEAEIGEEGGFTVKAGAGDVIAIGNGARLLGGGSLTLSNSIGMGAQILGPIRCQNCRLGDGGSYRHPEPDERGGVLKGTGVARGIDVPKGHVIQAFGLFSEGVLRRQSHFHPKTDP
jgi:carbonic anhydrase/acetyltransferase-like protein (isoleucine patch superfamily)